MEKRNDQLGYKETIRAALRAAAAKPNEERYEYEIDMGKTAAGNPRFPSRTDGVERGIIENGLKLRRF